MSYSIFKIEKIDNGQIAKISINRPKAMNAMNPPFF
jgi:enoyl-CoA hydratase/carnithine racemase